MKQTSGCSSAHPAAISPSNSTWLGLAEIHPFLALMSFDQKRGDHTCSHSGWFRVRNVTQARPKRPSIGLLLKLVVKDLAFHRAAKLVGSNPGQGWGGRCSGHL